MPKKELTQRAENCNERIFIVSTTNLFKKILTVKNFRRTFILIRRAEKLIDFYQIRYFLSPSIIPCHKVLKKLLS